MKNSKKGFTLIELLIAMAIIAMLAVLGGANYINSQKRARNARRQGDLEQVRAALEMYRTDKGKYYDTLARYCSDTQTPADARTNYNNLINALLTDKYLTKGIQDPMGVDSGYAYCVPDNNARTYYLCSTYELTSSPTTCGAEGSSGTEFSGWYGTTNP